MTTAKPIRILLVDDDESDYIITRDLLMEIGPLQYKLDWVDTFDKGLQEIVQFRHDVYLIDYHLGGRDGLELLRHAQAFGCEAPLILLTGLGDMDVDTLAMRAGAEDFLVKGQINAKSLGRSIRYAIERKGAEREIQKLAAFPRCNPIPVLELTAEGAMTYCNDAAKMMAQSLGEGSIVSLLPSDTKEIITECLLTGKDKVDLKTPVGDRTLSWTFVSVKASNVVHCYVKEITERLNLEAQLRHSVKMDTVGQLAAGVAHDFNNILTIVQGHASLLLANPSHEGDARKSLEQICNASDRASNLIRQLLMFSSKQVMQPRYLDLNEVINNITRMLQRVLGEHIALQCQPERGLPSVYADMGMVEQALMNLVINARDAMPRGGALSISTRSTEITPETKSPNTDARPGRFVVLTVGDTGMGMDSAILNRIFEPFFTTKEVGKGTGLGLATVYGIVKQHEGWIEVESQPGLGTTFKLYFPSSAKSAEIIPVDAATPAKPVKGGAETILIVEDEPALRELVGDILQIYGYQVLQAPSGKAALAVWEKHKHEVDLLLTDMVMPEGISGRELAEKLQEERPELKVIYTSGYSPGMAGRDIALLEGFNFLPKPYPPTKLAKLVRECLDLPRKK